MADNKDMKNKNKDKDKFNNLNPRNIYYILAIVAILLVPFMNRFLQKNPRSKKYLMTNL